MIDGCGLNPDNAAELFEVCSRMSCEQVELLLAARFLQPDEPDVREAIQRTPTRSEVRTPDGGCAVDAAPSAAPAGPPNRLQIKRETDEGPHALEAVPIRRTAPVQRRLEPLSVDRFAVRFTADTE